MSDETEQTIRPTWTPKDWRTALNDPRIAHDAADALSCFGIFDGRNPAPKLAALANAARRDDDPGKITALYVRQLRQLAEYHHGIGGHVVAAGVERIADALAELLPPA